MTDTRTVGFEHFASVHGLSLRRVLIAHYGADIGPDLHADALAYAWEHWDTVSLMDNPLGYLYRVAQSAARKHHRWGRAPAFPPETGAPADARGYEPGLDQALLALTEAQRVSVVLVHSFGWAYAEVADLLEVPVTTVRNHVHRGLERLRTALGAKL